uniref:NF-kappa-B essential modulator n=1 Tax=Oncorhynchus kisutch TaxID=8019 RepID=A0A8C7KU10_ONCKI
MVQPQADMALQWEMAGEEGNVALQVPAELAANEVVTRLLGDNQQLREALQRSNQALRQRCEEMEEWQRRSREEREFLSCRFQEARALVERLAMENHSLTSLASPSSPSNPGANQGLLVNGPIHGSEPNGPMASSLVTCRRRKQLSPAAEEPQRGVGRRMRDLRRRNEELEKEREEGERERDCLHRSVEQLRTKPVCVCGVTVILYRELQEQLDSLQKSSAQRDRTEVLLKQKDKDCTQLDKDVEALKAQVTSLLGELRERQSCLDRSQQDRNILDDRLSSTRESLAASEREMEQQRKQHSVTVDKLLLQTHNLETALKTDRLVITEERRKLAQLQHAYTCLFKDYDSKLKTEGGDMVVRLEEAERALALKQDLIDKLKEEVEQQRGSLETVPVLTAQAEIYKADFLAEREAREKLNQRKEELQDQLNTALAEMERLKQEETSRARMEKMQQRHLEVFRPPRPHITPQSGSAFNSSSRSVGLSAEGVAGGGAEELPDYRCPKCQYQAPDMDTLQIHVMDCIQ